MVIIVAYLVGSIVIILFLLFFIYFLCGLLFNYQLITWLAELVKDITTLVRLGWFLGRCLFQELCFLPGDLMRFARQKLGILAH